MSVLANLALQEFRLRQSRARGMIAERVLSAETAAARLAPWASIAIMAGADLPELAEEIAAQPIHWTARQRRAQVVDDLCPAAQWQAELARARDEAIVQATRNPAAHPRALGIVMLANALIPFIPSALDRDPKAPVEPQKAIAA